MLLTPHVALSILYSPMIPKEHRAGTARLRLVANTRFRRRPSRLTGRPFCLAWNYLVPELARARECRLFLPLMVALSGIALLLADKGEAERSVEVYALAARHPLVAESRWFADVAGLSLAAVATRLPLDTCEAAQARGRAMDLWQGAIGLHEELVAPTLSKSPAASSTSSVAS